MSQSPLVVDSIDPSGYRGSDAQSSSVSLGGGNKLNDNSSRPTKAQNLDAATRWKLRALIIYFRFILPFFPEFFFVELKSGPPDSETDDPYQSAEGIMALLRRIIQAAVRNLHSFGARCIYLLLEPKHLALPILDFFSFFVSILWNRSNHGPDILYPFITLQKQKSERLARLLTDHSRGSQHQNLHVATSRISGVDPPRVAVIDLNEVPGEITRRGYTAPADFHGSCVVFLLHLFASFFWFVSHLWSYDTVNEADDIWINYLLFSLFQLRSFISLIGAAAHGDGTVTLVQRSDASAPGCAVLLDRGLTVVLMGPHNIVEAIGKSGFVMSLSASLVQRHWQIELGEELLTPWELYDTLIGFCKGIPSLILAGFSLVLLGWLRLSNVRDPAAIIATIPPIIHLSSLIISDGKKGSSKEATYLSIFLFIVLVFPMRSLATDTKPPIQVSLVLLLCFQQIIALPIKSCLFSNVKYHIRIEKFLDVLGHPPVRRWEFNTLAAAATFQCLVVCHGIPRPVKNIDVLGLLDTFVLDDRDVWKAWKDRVADRIAHEVDILFTPTIPTFGDPELQKRLKQLLDEAQEGYHEYRKFYDHHVPLYSSV